MKDLIDREKALDCFHDWVDKYGDVHTADEMTKYQAIEALPTEKSLCALCQYNDLEWDEEPCESCTGENNHFKPKEQPEQQWISICKRLPEDMTRVLTTIKMPRKEPRVRSGLYSNGLFMNDNGDVWRSTDKEVKAWMPLPEPYKGDK